MSELRSACCDAAIVHFDCCGDCKEHCDVYCTGCGEEYPNGTETCNKCDSLSSKITLQEVRERLGLAEKE